ncbi:MAG: phosphopantetheine-binding protein [Desulfobacterales bacterium]|nr:phosphopantetheine-binding protein [Desulfobacterales bacterium]
MTTNDEVIAKILDILIPLVPAGVEITAKTEMTADLGLDSLKVMKILERLEDDFDISIPINILPKIRTIGDLSLQIEKLKGNGC